MDARWLIAAKFAPPAQGRRQIERARILDRLAPQANRLIVVQAAAGFGKSTLLAQWANRLAGAGTLVAWLNLDEDDRQSEPFVTYLAETLRRSLATVSGEGAAVFASYAGLPARTALSAIISELGRRNRPIALVLDDFHRAESDEIDAIVRLFLDGAPGCVSVALATRSPPRLGLARLRAERRVMMIGDRDLRFNEGETSLFLAAKRPRLDHADWLRFAARAEGWPVALQFARMLLDEGGALSTLSAASEANDLGAYLSEQVFDVLTPEQQDFLLRTSPLETICEESAAAVGVERAGARLREFARSALPMVILSQEPLRFRYHHLLQDFLISRARDSAIDLLDIHRRAARWFASSGDLASAVRHALAGADAPSAADIIEKAGGWRLVYRGLGHLGMILRTVYKTLGEEAIKAPRLALGAAVVAAKSGDLATASDLLKKVAVRGFDQDPERADELRVIDALIKLYCDQPLPDAALDRLTELVGRMDDADPMTPALGTNLVSFFTLQKGDFLRARRFGERAIRYFRQADALFGEMHLYAHIGQAELAIGGLAAAEINYRTMRDLCRERLGEGSDLEAIASVLAAEARCLADDRPASRRLLVPALARIEEGDGWFDVFAAGYLTAIRLELCDHGPAAAYAAIERGSATATRRSMCRLSALLEEELIRVATICGETERAQVACAKAGLSLDAADAGQTTFPVSSLRGDGHALIAARLLIGIDRPQEALTFLQVAEHQAQKNGTPLSRRITARALRALAENRLGRRSQALSFVSTAMGLAGPDKFSRTLLDEGEEFQELAEGIAKASGSDGALRDRVRRLFNPHQVDEAPVRTPDEVGLSQRERQILDLLADGLSNKEIARRIGLDPNTVKYHLKRLYGKLSVERRTTAVVRARNYGLIV